MEIPTYRGGGMTPGGYFLSLLRGQQAGAPRPAARTARGVNVPILPGRPPYKPAAASPAAMPLEAAVRAQMMRQSPMASVAQQQQKQPPQRGFMGMIPGINTPGGAGLAQAAATGLQLSGYQDRPVTTGQALGAMFGEGMKAYRETRRQDLADQIAMAELGLKANKGILQGKSAFAQTGNVLLELAPKIKDGSASAEEKALYAYVYGTASKPQTQTSFDAEGNKTITEIPAQDLPQELFPRPEGFRDPLKTTQPGAKSLKDAVKLKDSQKMLQNLNAYRQILMNPDFDLISQGAGAMGFPNELASRAQSAAETLRLDLKTLYELGALVGGDFTILDNLLTGPNTPKGIAGGRDFLLAQLDELERQLELDMGIKDVQLSGTMSLPIIADSKEAYDAAPNYTYVKLPNGNVVYKDPRKRAQ